MSQNEAGHCVWETEGSSTVIEILLVPSQTDYSRNLFHYRFLFSRCLLLSVPPSEVLQSRLPLEVLHLTESIWGESGALVLWGRLHLPTLIPSLSAPVSGQPSPSPFAPPASPTSPDFAPSLLLHSDQLAEEVYWWA